MLQLVFQLPPLLLLLLLLLGHLLVGRQVIISIINLQVLPNWVTIANGTTSLQWTIGGLQATTSYDWRVRANCSSGISSYTQTQFTSGATGSCSAPGGLYTSNIASSTATLNWNAVNGAFAYTVQYKPVSSGTWIVATSATYGLSVNLYSLSANTTYDWRVYSNCSLTEVSGYSYGQFTTSGSTVQLRQQLLLPP